MNKIIERTNKKINNDRRQFLNMLLKSGVSTKLLASSNLAAGVFASRFAQAQESNRNIVFVYVPLGASIQHWLPTSLTEMNTITEPYAEAAQNIAFRVARRGDLVQGLPQRTLGATEWHSSNPKSTSLNLQMAKVIGGLSPFPSLELGVQTRKEQINQLNGEPVAIENSPRAVYEKLFNIVPPTPTGAPKPFRDKFENLLRAQQINRQALAEIQNKIGNDERISLESHLHHIERLEERLHHAELADGQQAPFPTPQACPLAEINDKDTSVIGTFRLQSDLACAALNCGLTQIISIQISDSGESWRGDNSGDDTPSFIGSHHEACHQLIENQNEMATYLSKCVAYLIKKLEDNQLLENTILVQVTDEGDCFNHTPVDVPTLIASKVNNFNPGISTTPYFEDILADAVKGMGLEYAVGGDIANYGKGSGVFS